MTTQTTPNMYSLERVALSQAGRDWAHTATRRSNDWGGIDFRSDAQTVRICPIDGEWSAGFEVYVLTPNAVLLTDAAVHCSNPAERTIVAVADALVHEARKP